MNQNITVSISNNELLIGNKGDYLLGLYEHNNVPF